MKARLLLPIFPVLFFVAGCSSSEPPVRDDMGDASEIISEYCDPFPTGPRPTAAAVRRAADRIAVVANNEPDRQFLIDDSGEPTTASDLLRELRQLARDKHCRTALMAIPAARR